MGFESGAGEFMQAGSYSSAQMRRSVFAWAARTSANTEGTINGGLLSAADMQLTAAASGLVVYTSVGACLIGGSEASNQGGYHAFLSSQNSTTLATANATNPRIDLICATVGDASYTIPSGGTSGAVVIQAVTGTPTAGATLTNLSGAPPLPASSLLLGYVQVPAAATNITNANIANKATTVGSQTSAPYLIVGTGSNTSVATSTNTSAPFGAISSGHGVSLTSGGFSISQSGVYYATAVAEFNTATAGYVSTMLAQNGAVHAAARVPPSGTDNIRTAASNLFACASGDGIAVQLFQDSGGTMATCKVVEASIFYVGAP